MDPGPRTRGPGTQGPRTQRSSSVALSFYDRNATCVNVLSSNVRLYHCGPQSSHCYTHSSSATQPSRLWVFGSPVLGSLGPRVRHGTPRRTRFEIHWISRGFQISEWISGFQGGFLDFKVDFWISKRISGFRLNLYYSEDTAKIYS